MKTEKRGDKYIVKCSDGEVEHSESEYLQILNFFENWSNWLDKWIEKYGHHNWTFENYPKEADMYLQMDLYYEKAEEWFLKILNDEGPIKGIDNIEKEILEIIGLMSSHYEKEAINPLGKLTLIASYSLKHLEAIKKKVCIAAEFERKKLLFNNPKPGRELNTLSFEEIFVRPEYAEACLNILRELEPPVIDADNNYIGKSTKGVFRLWIDKLKHKAIVKHFSNDITYADAIRKKIKGLTFTKDASEFRTNYVSLNNSDIGLQITNKLSQFPQKGGLGK